VQAARALGAYYTPARLAEPLCRWAIRNPRDTVLDPSCGEGAFLAAAAGRLLELGSGTAGLARQVQGVDLDPRALARARGRLASRHPALRGISLGAGDFFRFARERMGLLYYDAVVGNPPFLRTQGRPPAAKRRELDVARRLGAVLTADASAWAPFVAAAAGFVRPGGRLAMVVPREALFVNYARPLLHMLERRFAAVHLAALGGRWFDGALVQVALLLAEGNGPGSLRFHEVSDPEQVEELARPDAGPPPGHPWVWDRIPRDCRDAVEKALESPGLVALTAPAELTLGAVTGDLDFFLLPSARARALGLPADFLRPALSRPSQLVGTAVTAEDLARMDRAGEPLLLLAVPPGYGRDCRALEAYLAEGAERGVPRRYKCRTRSPWYSVRRLGEAPHAFLGYLVKRRLRIAANPVRAQSTNNLHRIRFRPPWDRQAEVLCAAALNGVTGLSVELLGRVAAGGVLKIEPRDAGRIRIPRPEALLEVPGVEDRVRAIDRALREGRDAEAFAAADAWTARALGWDAALLARLRRAQEELRDRRLAPAPRAGDYFTSRASLRARAEA